MMKLRSMHGSSAIILATREVQEGGLLGSGFLSKKEYEIDYMIEERSSRTRSTAQKDTPSRSLQQETDFTGDSLRSAARRLDAYRRASTDVEENPNESPSDFINSLLKQYNEDDKQFPRNQKSEEKSLPEVRAENDETREPKKQGGPRLTTKVNYSPEELAALLGTHDISTVDVDDEIEEDPGTDPFESLPKKPSFETPQQATAQKKEESKNSFDNSGNPSWLETSSRSSRNFQQIRNRLIQTQLSTEFTDEFLKKLENNLSRVDLEEYKKVKEKTIESLAAMIRSAPDIAPPRGECRAVMLMGPTGSGKTTSLAKLAARYHLIEKREVSIYSLDHYRLAATEQLKTYASVMNLPFFAPISVDEFREYMRRDGAELMFIDTSGIGHRDHERLKSLKEYVDACEVKLEKHLVLAANTSPNLIDKILLAYDTIGFDKLILTKLDETEFIGAFIEYADKFNRPFSFMTNGQDVPGDIVEMKPVEIARMLLND